MTLRNIWSEAAARNAHAGAHCPSFARRRSRMMTMAITPREKPLSMSKTRFNSRLSGAKKHGRRSKPGRPEQDREDHDARPRLQKVLAAAGLGSRRKCEEIIVLGRVEVDRRVVKELGTRVDPV